MSKIITVFTDGGARGNPGPAAVGVVIKRNGTYLAEIGKKIGVATNNVAEYSAVIEALSFLIENKDQLENIEKIIFSMDSELVVHQLNGLYRVKNPNLRQLMQYIKTKEQELGKAIEYKHVFRESNKEADRLVNMALDNKI